MNLENTVGRTFLARVNHSRGRVAVRFKQQNRWIDWTWEDYYGRVRLAGLGLLELGIKRLDRVALMGQTRPEWAAVDLANMCIGAITVPIYPTSSNEDIEYLINHAECKVLVLENQKLLDIVKPLLKNCPTIQHVIHMDHAVLSEKPAFNFMSLEDLKALGSKRRLEDFESQIREAKPDDHITYNYTSGTTGRPKGVIITNRMVMSEVSGVNQMFRGILNQDDVILSFLPQSHIFGKLEYLFGLGFGWIQTYAQSLETLVVDLAEVKPTFMFAVPRIYEKFFAKLQSMRDSMPPTKKKLFDWAVSVGIKVALLEEQGKTAPMFLQLQKKLANKIVFDKVRVDRFGGRLKFFVSGSAPLGVDIARFFAACGMKILEGYGLTESSAAAFVNPLHLVKYGTVGRALPGVELKLAPEDGEILLKGDIITTGYYKDPEATAAAFQDGWFCTGDIGSIDEDGFLKITDRKKDLIKTAAGKFIAPQKLENRIKENPIISQALVFGDQRKYIVALFTINLDFLKDQYKNQGKKVPTEFWKDPELRHTLEAWLAQVNSKLGNYETIKKFDILPHDFTVEAGELTPSLKVKRKVCNVKYAEYLEKMY